MASIRNNAIGTVYDLIKKISAYTLDLEFKLIQIFGYLLCHG